MYKYGRFDPKPSKHRGGVFCPAAGYTTEDCGYGCQGVVCRRAVGQDPVEVEELRERVTELERELAARSGE